MSYSSFLTTLKNEKSDKSGLRRFIELKFVKFAENYKCDNFELGFDLHNKFITSDTIVLRTYKYIFNNVYGTSSRGVLSPLPLPDYFKNLDKISLDKLKTICPELNNHDMLAILDMVSEVEAL